MCSCSQFVSKEGICLSEVGDQGPALVWRMMAMNSFMLLRHILIKGCVTKKEGVVVCVCVCISFAAILSTNADT